ncbi:MAG: hypothetical protein R3D26_11610 [Cyanobacteriota/Melainabacteria group bacterium]
MSPKWSRAAATGWSLWSIESGAPVKKLSGHKGDILSVAVSSDGSRIITASRDLTARIWSTATGAEEQKLVGHGNWVLRARFPDRRQPSHVLRSG